MPEVAIELILVLQSICRIGCWSQTVHLVCIDMYLYCHGISCRCIFLAIAVRILLCTVATANVLAVFTLNLLLLLHELQPVVADFIYSKEYFNLLTTDPCSPPSIGCR